MIALVTADAIAIVAFDQAGALRRVVLVAEEPALLHVDDADAIAFAIRLGPGPTGVDADRRRIQIVLRSIICVVTRTDRGIAARHLKIGMLGAANAVQALHQLVELLAEMSRVQTPVVRQAAQRRELAVGGARFHLENFLSTDLFDERCYLEVELIDQLQERPVLVFFGHLAEGGLFLRGRNLGMTGKTQDNEPGGLIL